MYQLDRLSLPRYVKGGVRDLLQLSALSRKTSLNDLDRGAMGNFEGGAGIHNRKDNMICIWP